MIVSNLSGVVLVLGFRALGPLWHLWGGFDSTVGVPGAWWTSKNCKVTYLLTGILELLGRGGSSLGALFVLAVSRRARFSCDHGDRGREGVVHG